MSLFEHVKDEGVRKFLKDNNPPEDYNLFANQIKVASKHLNKDLWNEEINPYVLEYRYAALSVAEQSFGYRDLRGCHMALKEFWRV